MTRSTTLLVTGFALATLFAIGGCRTTHLGQDTAGYAYKNAMRLQAQGDDAVEAPTLSADDAKQILQVQKTGKADGSATTTSVPLVTPMTLTSTPSSTAGGNSGGSGMWPGATGNIVLEAK